MTALELPLNTFRVNLLMPSYAINHIQEYLHDYKQQQLYWQAFPLFSLFRMDIHHNRLHQYMDIFQYNVALHIIRYKSDSQFLLMSHRFY